MNCIFHWLIHKRYSFFLFISGLVTQRILRTQWNKIPVPDTKLKADIFNQSEDWCLIKSVGVNWPELMALDSFIIVIEIFRRFKNYADLINKLLSANQRTDFCKPIKLNFLRSWIFLKDLGDVYCNSFHQDISITEPIIVNAIKYKDNAQIP